jgi:polysaccharide pyruvyl transferase WcaK-like protein
VDTDTATGVAAEAADAARLRSVASLRRYASAAEPDTVFLDDMQQRIDTARRQPHAHRIAPGGSLRILLLGYAGAANTGADLRTIETILQLQRIFGTRAQLRLLPLGDCFDHPVLAAVTRLVPGLAYFPDALDVAIRESDVVINVEGSTYTSRFSDSLTGILIGGIALAAALGRTAIAYGVDSGTMSPALLAFVQRNAGLGHVIARNEAARIELRSLGIACHEGADTAWTYRAQEDARVAADAWPTVALCPGNPYWWPVKADAARAFALDARGEKSSLRYGPLHFHTWDEHRCAAFDAYLDRFARIAVTLQAQGYQPVLVGMEQLDGAACAALAARLPFAVDKVVRGPATLAEVAAAVSFARCVVTTRYHAAVLAISHGVPVFGLSMDTRIDRLLAEAHIHGWHASCDAADGDVSALRAIGSLEGQGNHEPGHDEPIRDRLRARMLAYAQSQRASFCAMGESLVSLIGSQDKT